MEAGAAFRFGIGDLVRCKISVNQWRRGEVVALNYREDHWSEGMIAPYQVQLDSGQLIYAPQDDDRLIQALGKEDLEEDSTPEIFFKSSVST